MKRVKFFLSACLFLAVAIAGIKKLSIVSVKAQEVIPAAELLPTLVVPNQVNGASAGKRTPIKLNPGGKSVYGGGEKVTVSIDNGDRNQYTYRLLDNENKEIKAEFAVSTAGSTDEIAVSPPPQFKPGKYSVVIEDETGQEIFQNFIWGVLAFNADKGEYRPGETANLAMAVLDQNGATVCDAVMNLEIRENGNKTETLSTENGRIKINPECNSKKVTTVPDYEADYKFNKTGEFTFRLTATTANGNYTVDQKIPVKNILKFAVARESSTRIYPPNTIPMTIRITAAEDFDGSIYEEVPKSFEVRNAGGEIQSQETTQKIIWKTKIAKGETKTFSYDFLTPNVSPQFYNLGPVKMATLTDLVYEEPRQWQIAADDNGQVTIRQEINILSSTLAVGGTFGAMINIDDSKYNNAAYYFEAVGAQGAGTTVTVNLVDDSGTKIAGIGITNTATNVRTRKAITPTSGSHDYHIELQTGTTPMVRAARVIIIQTADNITATETQIEIGALETGLTFAAAAPLTFAKYWTYNSANWDAGTTFYAEITYNVTGNVAAGSTSFTTPGTYSWPKPAGVANITVEAWGGGGAGGGATSRYYTGGGGGGGQYVKKTFNPGTGSFTVGVGGTTDGTTGAGGVGSTSTFGGTQVRAMGGGGGAANGGVGGTGSTNNGVGDTIYKGGNGVNGSASGGSVGAGGGGGGSGGNGGNGTGATAGVGTTVGGGDGGGGLSVQGNGRAGSAAGGGGGGAYKTDNKTSLQGGNGAPGRVDISWSAVSVDAGFYLQEDNGSWGGWTNVATITSSGGSEGYARARTATPFTPTNGRHYRVAGVLNSSGGSYSIYNAKIIADQSGAVSKLEPQYLLANVRSGLASATNTKQLWNTGEWARVTNSYYHALDALGTGSSAGAKIQDVTASADLQNSNIGGTNQVISVGISMPVTGHEIDSVIPATGANPNGSRILVKTVINTHTIDFSGKCKKWDGTSSCSNGETVRYAVNGSLMPSTSTIDTGGSFVFTGQTQPAPGDILTFFISGAGVSQRANTVTKYAGSTDFSGVMLYENHLTIGHSGGTETFSNSDLSTYDNSVAGAGSSEVFFEVDVGSTLTTDIRGQLGQHKLYVYPGNEFRPQGKIYTGSVNIGGTLTADANSFYASGSWSNTGTFNANTGTIKFNGTAAANILSGTLAGTIGAFNNLTFDGVGGNWRFDVGATVGSDLTIVNGGVTLPLTAITVGGNYANSGAVTNNNGTVTFNSTTTGRTVAGNMTGANGFNNLTFNGSGGSWSFSAAAEAAGSLKIISGGITAPSSTLSVGQSLVSNGGFTHNSGTIVLNTGATTVFSVATAEIYLNNLSVTVPGKAVKFTQNIAAGGAQSTYYFDSSDSPPSDPNNKWTNDANAFDSDATPSTYATIDSSYGDATANYLMGAGTNSPTSGTTIDKVEARMYGAINSGAAGWTSYTLLTTPSGGWTWQKVNDLETYLYEFSRDYSDEGVRAEIYTSGKGQLLGAVEIGAVMAGVADIYKIEVRLTPVSGGPQFNFAGNMTVTGAQNNLVYITSDVGTTQWKPNFATDQNNFSYAHISWGGCATGTANVYLNTADSTNGGNNGSCWVFQTSGSGPATHELLRHGEWFTGSQRQKFTF